MELIHKSIECKGRSDKFYLYVLGDIHIGAINCAESQIKRLIKRIHDQKNSYWIGGGDVINAIKQKDAKRFDMANLPDWILEGSASKIRDNLKDITRQEAERFILMTESIKDKCIGMIEGNHEESIRKNYGEDIHAYICKSMDTADLTDAAFIRLKFGYKVNKAVNSSVLKIFICHGQGSGRTAGSEPNKLYRLASDKEADLILCGHSHSFCLLPPIPVLGIPDSGELPKELTAKYKRAANWGCWMLSFKRGPSTYDSRALYPARSLSTLEICIEPLKHCEEYKKITMSELIV